MSFLPRVPLLFMISLPCGSDLLLLQHLLSSLPSPNHSQSEGSLGRRNQTNCSHSSWLVWSPEMLQRGSPCRAGLLWAWRGIGLYVIQFILFPWYSLWTHNTKLKDKIRGERKGTNKKSLKSHPAHAGHGPLLPFWKKNSKVKLSHVWYCKRRKESQEAGKDCRACNGKSSLCHWAVLL